MTATFYIGDALEVMSKLPEKSVDLVLSSPPFLALRSYLPSDHPDKSKEGGSQATPGEYIDWLVDVAEACDRVLAPHGSLCFELGDTYAGSGGGGGDYLEGGWREGQAQFSGSGASMRESNAAHWRQKNGKKDAWPLAKSLTLIPELFRLTLVYGVNPLTGRQTERWRLRNVIRWVRPNPPVGALGDKFRPATSELMVFCKSTKRYFDLDAVREPSKLPGDYGFGSMNNHGADDSQGRSQTKRVGGGVANPAGAPPLDWWEISLLDDEAKPQSDKKPRNRQSEPAMSRGGNWNTFPNFESSNPLGAPPLDWWNIPPGGYEGAHYAVFPPELCVKPIKAMSPETVCRTCGEPRRRIVNNRDNWERQPALAAHIKERREAAGVSVQELNDEFGYVAGAAWWETTTLAARVPNPTDYTKLKTRLNLSDEFDDMIYGERIWTESEIEYRDVSDAPSGWTQDGNGRVYQRLASRKDRIAPDRFSDCGHDNWRPGMVLDPFAGSGTTLAVATGHGREAIGIDLDERNYDLALERVGPMLLQRGEVPA